MRLRADQLPQQLRKGLLPVYIVSGDETLLVQECCDSIRAACREQGFTEREVIHTDAKFDWGELLASANSLSLFAEKKLIELRLPTGKPGDQGGKALVEYCNNTSADTVLLIICNKLESSTSRSKWYKTLESTGASLPVWPIDANQLPRWLEQRLAKVGLKASREAVQLIAERVEGNLLAAAQEIEKLRLFTEADVLDADTVTAAVADSARYDVFGLVDRAMQGDCASALKMLRGLRAEGIEGLVVLWALSRELRTLCSCAGQIAQGNGIDRVLQNHRVWDHRKGLTKSALNRLNAKKLRELLQLAASTDQTLKGMGNDDGWLLMERLVVGMTGKELPLPA